MYDSSQPGRINSRRFISRVCARGEELRCLRLACTYMKFDNEEALGTYCGTRPVIYAIGIEGLLATCSRGITCGSFFSRMYEVLPWA